MGAHDDASDEQLLVAWKAGDQAAGMALVRRYDRSVARFFAYKLERGPESEDLAQATFLAVLSGDFRGESSFRTYLFAVARNQLLRCIRERVRDRQRFDPSETSIAALELSPSAVLVVRQRNRLLLLALRRLPVDTQIMLELHYWEQMKIKDIAEVLELNINMVKARMKRGRERLEREMEALAESKEQLETTRDELSNWAERLRNELR
ncbi:MAG: RNA polymerase sigma factor [Myxococcales bacterium]|nr:RNA polymerase sigma factor [Myxococcales bacterium]